MEREKYRDERKIIKNTGNSSDIINSAWSLPFGPTADGTEGLFIEYVLQIMRMLTPGALTTGVSLAPAGEIRLKCRCLPG